MRMAASAAHRSCRSKWPHSDARTAMSSTSTMPGAPSCAQLPHSRTSATAHAVASGRHTARSLDGREAFSTRRSSSIALGSMPHAKTRHRAAMPTASAAKAASLTASSQAPGPPAPTISDTDDAASRNRQTLDVPRGAIARWTLCMQRSNMVAPLVDVWPTLPPHISKVAQLGHPAAGPPDRSPPNAGYLFMK